MDDTVIMQEISQKVVSIKPSIFSVISARATEIGAVNLGQGFPDYDADSFIKNAAIEAIQSGSNQYAPSSGVMALQSAIEFHEHRFYGLTYTANDNITITSGATEALWVTFQAILNTGDEVIVLEPAYDSYAPAILFAGGAVVPCRLTNENYELDSDLLESLITTKTKAIIITNPHNPTGKVFSKQELESITLLALKHNFYVICDEVYEHLTFGIEHIAIPTLFEDKKVQDKIIRISSLGKTFSVTGWKIGWVLASSEITKAVRAVHQFVVFSVATPFQIAASKALTMISEKSEYIHSNAAILKEKRDLLVKSLKKVGLIPYIPFGGYFVMADYSSIFSGSSTEFSTKLLEDSKVATIPTAPFYTNTNNVPTRVRFCFCKKDSTIQNAISNLVDSFPQVKENL